jgi:sacsin
MATVSTKIPQQHVSRSDQWLMVNSIGGGKARELACRTNEHNLKLVPWVGVAALIKSSESPIEVGRAYCFLPLPVKTSLPVQINGYFELSSNRRDIWHGTDMTGVGQLRSEWNSVLLEDVIGPAYAKLLLEAAKVLGFTNQFLQLWPTSTGNHGNVAVF